MTDDRDRLLWRKERSEEAGDFRHFRVRRNWCRSPGDGTLHDFYVLDMPDWVQVIALTGDGRFVMVEQYRHGVDVVTLEFPAGLVEACESAEQCAERELEEETGYCGEAGELLGRVYPNPALQVNRLSIVLLRECYLTGRKHEDAREFVRHHLVSPGEVDGMIRRGELNDAYGIVAWDHYRRWRARTSS